MAESDISGFDGDVTLPSGHGGDAYAWSLRAVMRKKDVSRYGGGRGAVNRGGLIDTTGNVRFFARQGAANTAPGAASMAANGAALTLTAMTGCLYSGTALFDVSLDSAFGDPAVEGSYDFTFTGAVTETWAVV